jgi:hypothetical protein
VLLRLPSDLHRSLARAAADAGLSFNELCVRRLTAPAPEDWAAARALVVGRAHAMFGDRLHGVIALGSWARGDAGRASDIDVLLVVDAAVPLTRSLYRRWDEAPLTFEERVIDPHFTHLPPPGTGPGPAWCEAAVDGLVWYDRGGRVADRLAEVRRAIADGRVMRAFSHGQPYWKGVA